MIKIKISRHSFLLEWKLRARNNICFLFAMYIDSSEVSSEIYSRKMECAVVKKGEMFCDHNLLFGDRKLVLSRQLAPA